MSELVIEGRVARRGEVRIKPTTEQAQVTVYLAQGRDARPLVARQLFPEGLSWQVAALAKSRALLTGTRVKVTGAGLEPRTLGGERLLLMTQCKDIELLDVFERRKDLA